MTEQQRGALVVVEGADGSGKTKLAELLLLTLARSGPVQCVGFVGYGHIEDSFVKQGHIAGEIQQESVGMIQSSQRWLVYGKIVSALENGTTVVCDDYAYGAIEYLRAGASRKQGVDWEGMWRGMPLPDAVFCVSCDIETAKKRSTFGDKVYRKDELQTTVKEALKKRTEDNAHNPVSKWIEVDSSMAPEVMSMHVREDAKAVVERCYNGKALAYMGVCEEEDMRADEVQSIKTADIAFMEASPIQNDLEDSAVLDQALNFLS